MTESELSADCHCSLLRAKAKAFCAEREQDMRGLVKVIDSAEVFEVTRVPSVINRRLIRAELDHPASRWSP